MRIFAFARRYPIPFKPYYDTQFADLVERGHELAIFSAGALDGEVQGAKVRRFGLDRRTRRYPSRLAEVPLALGACVTGGLARPASSLRAARRILDGAGERSTKRTALDLLRMLAVNAAEPDLCLVHGLGTGVLFRWLRDAFPTVPAALYYHGGEVAGVPTLPHRLSESTFRAFDIVFTNTRCSAEEAAGRGCPPGRLRVLPVGFDLRSFDPPTRKPTTPPLRLLSAARLSEGKAHIDALRALVRLSEWGLREFRYEIAGDGGRRPVLERFVRENGLGDRVRFLGVVPNEEVRRRMRAAHALVLPSRAHGSWKETQACAVQEAMAERCLVITTRTGGVPESIPSCMRRLSAPEGDEEGLARSLAEVYRMGDGERERLADECRTFVTERYDIVRLNDRMLELATDGRGAIASRERPRRAAGAGRAASA